MMKKEDQKMADEKITERSADFEERVKAGGPFKTEEFELMTQEEFDLVLPALGPAQAREAFLTRQKSEQKKRGTGPALECK
jgi:hypothetical protein